MLAHADKYSKAFHARAVENSNPKYSRVSYDEYLSGNYPKGDEWKYSSFWYKDFDGMAYKTMLRQLISKWGIMSIDMITAIDADMAVIHEDGTPEYVENYNNNDIVSEQPTAEEPENTQEPEPQEEDAGDVAEGFFS